jgi:adenylate kinase
MEDRKPYEKPIIFILGGPGSGKGTQCERIVEKYGFCHMSTGDLLRDEVKKETPRAHQLKETMASGQLVAQDTILALIRDAIKVNWQAKGYLIDGFPRDTKQGKNFERDINKCVCIMYFECSNDEMTKRLMGRAKTSGRVDDNPETIKKRLQTFEEQTKPVVAEWGNRVRTINAMRSADEIFKDVQKEFKNLMMYHSKNEFQFSDIKPKESKKSKAAKAKEAKAKESEKSGKSKK